MVSLALAQPWGRSLPRPVLIGVGWVGAAFAILHWIAFSAATLWNLTGITDGAVTSFDRWNLFVFEPDRCKHVHPPPALGLLCPADRGRNCRQPGDQSDERPVVLPVVGHHHRIVSGTVLSLLGALVIRRLGLWRELGLIGRPERGRTLLWCLPFAIFGVLPLTAGPDVTAGKVVGAVAFGVLVAFWKLTMLGLVLYAWLPRGARAAAALTACSFATMHVGGILMGGAVVPTLVLSLSYLFLGFAFVAVGLRIGLLWPLVCCYALVLTTAAMVSGDNGASNLAGSVSEMLPGVVISALLAAYGLIVWRRPRATAEPAGQPSDGPGVTSENFAGATHSPAARARRVVSTHD